VEVLRAEEKGSDVNLATHLVRDAFRGEFDVAVVISNDSALYEPIRIVTHELKKPVGLLVPERVTISTKLKPIASFIRHNRRRLRDIAHPYPRTNALYLILFG